MLRVVLYSYSSVLYSVCLTAVYDPYNDAKPESGNKDMCRFNSKSRIENAKQVCGTGKCWNRGCIQESNLVNLAHAGARLQYS